MIVTREIRGRTDVVIAVGGHKGGRVIQRGVGTLGLPVDPLGDLAQLLNLPPGAFRREGMGSTSKYKIFMPDQNL